MNVTEKLLKAALSELSAAARKRLLAPYTENRVGMRNSETPGHAFWYDAHLSDEREAAALLGLPEPKLGPKRRARAIEIDTTPFVAAHGKSPRGRGGWAFAANGNDEGDALIWANGLYRDAVKEAKAKAPEGTVVLAVQS